MTQNITELDQFDATVSYPSPGESVTAASQLLPLQPLANRTRYIKNRIDLFDPVALAGVPGISAGPLVFRVRLGAPYLADFTTDWSKGAYVTYSQASVATAVSIVFEPQFLPVGQITDFKIGLSHPVGGHGSLPATMPRFLLLKRAVAATGSPTTIADVTDSSASVGAYEAYHEVAATGLTETLSVGNVYILLINGEAGANSIAGLAIHGATCTIAAPP